MITLPLTFHQRIMLSSWLNNRQALTKDHARAVWAIQDKLDLTDEEGESINLHYTTNEQGQTTISWGQAKDHPVSEEKLTAIADALKQTKDIQLSDKQEASLRYILQRDPFDATDKMWVRPILDVVFPVEGV